MGVNAFEWFFSLCLNNLLSNGAMVAGLGIPLADGVPGPIERM